jgi:hypothetical protein
MSASGEGGRTSSSSGSDDEDMNLDDVSLLIDQNHSQRGFDYEFGDDGVDGKDQDENDDDDEDDGEEGDTLTMASGVGLVTKLGRPGGGSGVISRKSSNQRLGKEALTWSRGGSGVGGAGGLVTSGVTPTVKDSSNVPFPRLCGAVFNPRGKSIRIQDFVCV